MVDLSRSASTSDCQHVSDKFDVERPTTYLLLIAQHNETSFFIIPFPPP